MAPRCCYSCLLKSLIDKARVPISASAIAQLIEAMGPHRVMTVDLHCGQIQGFFQKIPVDNLFAVPRIELCIYLLGSNVRGV